MELHCISCLFTTLEVEWLEASKGKDNRHSMHIFTRAEAKTGVLESFLVENNNGS